MVHPYATEEYAASLAHIGVPLEIPEWGCWVLVRDIVGGGRDAVGCYPLTILSADADLSGGLARLRRDGLVSVTLTLDDTHRPDMAMISAAFSLVRPYKAQYLHLPDGVAMSRHHRAEVKRSARTVETGLLDLRRHFDTWLPLYDTLVRRHGLSGWHLFPASHVQTLAELEGTTAIGGWIDDKLVSAHIWVEHDGYVHSHLAASSEAGYAASAAYSVYAASFEYFRYASVLNLGGAPDGTGGGLAQFKAGFANVTSTSWLCGEVLDPFAYERLTKDIPRSTYFPLYRAKG